MDFYTRNNPNTPFEVIIVVDNRLGSEDWKKWEKVKSNWDNLVLVDFSKEKTKSFFQDLLNVINLFLCSLLIF